MQKVIISILNYNNSKDTMDCLDSIQRMNLDRIQVMTYVLDNGSRKKFVVEEQNYKEIGLRVIRSEKNLGFTGGHNFLYEKYTKEDFDYFLLLNNDCVLDENCLKSLVEGFSEGVGGVVPKIYFTKGREYHISKYKKEELGKVIWYAGGSIDWGNVVSKHIGLDEVDRGQFNKKIPITFATGACLLLSKDVLKKTGLFDDKYFLYYEDADLSTRTLRKGYKIIYNPNAVVWHNNAGSSGSGSNLHDYYLTRNKLLFGMRYASLKVKLLLIKEGLKILLNGRKWQKIGAKDYFIGKFGKGSYEG